ncbi:RecX family transcriptional regulator [Bulleidia sp. zg-1006]|uniref:RecX family transcriptional regulator n=1 Tax=Bulleidia sp. zg-1006 TaxID=2806552 RepID=UPI001939644D|nr:RecX family transcriptional regulator [Bulleidia sp. zg-1006]QRG86139.1 RecX family transcriptional regulator [Bulleidia sp. zg-1006]
MRIGLFSDTFVPEINGVANSTYILFQELKRHGHEVYVITTYTGKEDMEWNEDQDVLRLSGIQLKFLYGYVMASPFHSEALEVIRSLNLQIIHAQTEFGVGIFARICAKHLGVPLVSTYHTTYEDYTHYVNLLNSKTVDEVGKMAVAKLSRLYGESSQEVITPSLKTKEMLENYGIQRRLTVIPTGLSLERFNPKEFSEERRLETRKKYGLAENRSIIIYVGRLAKEKALDLVISGYEVALKKGAKSQLVIVGGGPDFDSLKKLVSKQGLEKDVILTGPIPRETVPDLYRSSNAFVSASLSETQGMTFIEALASGLPLFARKDEVLDGLLMPNETGWFFVDEESLANAILEFEKMDGHEYGRYCQRCVSVTKPFSAETFYTKILEVYSRVIDFNRIQYEILRMRTKDTIVELYLRSSEQEELRLKVSVDDYYEYGLRAHGFFNHHIYKVLKEKEVQTAAYQACLKKIAIKDRSQKEIVDWLTQNTQCSLDSVQAIIRSLKEKGYLNDERYAREHIHSLFSSLFGENEVRRRLARKGISEHLIQKALQEEPVQEEDFALEYARKILRSSSYSLKKTKETIRIKLRQRGYNDDLIDRVMVQLDFSKVDAKELDYLRKCANQAKKRYARKYSGTDLRNRIYRYCLNQGYSYEDVYTVINDMEDDDA